MATTVSARGPMLAVLKKIFIGPRLLSTEAAHQTISKKVGLAVFASDALSSTAYATEEILFVLVLAGVAYLNLSIPIALVIVGLLVIVTLSYVQTINAYPNGGGAYLVSRENLGDQAATIAGAALLTDYILTVAVSISSGVAQLASAFPQLNDWRVPIALVMIGIMTLINLRGVKESGLAFAIPTYFFLIVTVITIGYGMFQYATGTLGAVTGIEMSHQILEDISVFLILRAFSSGCAALTGIEAISDGILAFSEPRSRNASITLVCMSAILSVMFLSMTFLANQVHALPSHTETVFSQIGRTIYGAGNPFYLALLGGTTLILIMAANTAFADFPRLSAFMARDGFLPKQLTYRGSRLVFTYGIVGLAALASLLIVIFQAQTNALIPLYAVGVFLSFSISQAGMARRWWHSGQLAVGAEEQRPNSIVRHDPHWQLKMVINGFGAVCTFVVMIIFAVTKFATGAWVVVLLIPVLVFVFTRIHGHYRGLAKELSLESFGAPPRIKRHRVIVPIGGVHLGTLRALHYATAVSNDVTAVYIAAEPGETDRVKAKWEKWGDGVRLKVVESPYRLLYEPLLDYIQEVARQRQPNELITVVVPEFVPQRSWHNLLHMQTSFFLKLGLLGLKDIVITEVPYHVQGE